MKKIYLFVLSSLLCTWLGAAELKKLSVQLMWLDQFQFAGYYIAKEKGFYTDAGLDVEIKKFSYGVNPLEEVLQGRADFGVGRSSLILASSQGHDIVLLSNIFQSSPLVLIALESSDIDSVHDFVGKKIMMTKDAIDTASIHAMIRSYDIDESKIIFKEHTFDLEELIKGNIDLYSGYISNEPFLLGQKGLGHKIFAPKDEGFNFPSDILFTSSGFAESHKKATQAFNDATLAGWQYAFDHIKESVEIIYKRYNSQNKSRKALEFEARELKKLAYKEGVELGAINPEQLERIFDVYRLMGLAKRHIDVSKLIYKKETPLLSEIQKNHLKQKGDIRICIDPHAMPFSAISNGKILGMVESVLSFASAQTNVPFKLIPTSSWEESLEKIQMRECDLLPLAQPTKKRDSYIHFTAPYHNEPIVVVTSTKEEYILDFQSVAQKEFVYTKGSAFLEQIKERYPALNLYEEENMERALAGVKSGRYYGAIDVMVRAAYELSKPHNQSLKIAKQFDEMANVSFGVRSDDLELLKIFEKIAQSLKESNSQRIINEWMLLHGSHAKGFDYLYEILIAFVILTVLFLVRYYTIEHKNRELRESQRDLQNLNKNLENRILEKTQDLEKAQELAKIGSWIFDLRHATLRWSRQTYKMFEIDESVTEDLYAHFIRRVHPEDRELLEKSYYDALSKRQHYTFQHRLLMDDGSIKYVVETCETLYSSDGVALESYGTVQDITDAVTAKLELDKKDAYLLHQSRLAQMGEMLSMIAHQWKQPLSAISSAEIAVKMSLELEKYDLADEKERAEFLLFLKEKLAKIAGYTQSLSHIINDFSNFYKPTKNPEAAEVHKVVLSAYELISDIIKGEGIEVHIALESRSAIMMYKNEFIQMLINILNNAKEQFKTNPVSHADIWIRTHEDSEHIYVEIEDNAGGIEPSILSTIFDPYFSTKLEKNGTGLGLYMSKRILNDYHRGDIRASNTKSGALFTITLQKRDFQKDRS